MVLPFGKHRGKFMRDEEVPTSYLLWLFENTDDYVLSRAVSDELIRRVKVLLLQKGLTINADAEEKPQNIKDTYRKLAMKYHPDKGGSNEAMKAINEFYQLINK